MLNRRFKREEDGQSAPDRNDEYLLYQTLVGAWPVLPTEEGAEPLTARITAYMEKATKEAKRRTSWVNPDADYDRAVREFVTRILATDSAFRQVFVPFQRIVAVHGAVNSLAETLLKIASPGIPDFYQGAELWDLSLVDPDNRRPVDFSVRQQLLGGLREGRTPFSELLGSWRDGRIKLLVTQRALTLRRELAALFRSGAYRPLSAAGERAEHVVAFGRSDPENAVIVVVPRLSARLTGFNGEWPLGQAVWGDTWLPIDQGELAGEYVDHLSGLRVIPKVKDGRPLLSLGKLFETLPAWRHVGRRRGQLRPLQRARDRGGALSVRPGGSAAGAPANPHTGAHQPSLARLSARGAPGPPVRLPRPGALRARERASLQSGQAPPRSLRQGHRGVTRVARLALRLPDRRPGRGPDAGRP